MPSPYPSKVCPICGQTFTPINSRQIYCCSTCRNKARKSGTSVGKPIAHPDYGERYCIVCGMPFKPESYPQKTCSIFCRCVNEYMQSAPYQRKRMRRIKASETPEQRSARKKKAHDYQVEYYAKNRDRVINRVRENYVKSKERKNGNDD